MCVSESGYMQNADSVWHIETIWFWSRKPIQDKHWNQRAHTVQIKNIERADEKKKCVHKNSTRIVTNVNDRTQKPGLYIGIINNAFGKEGIRRWFCSHSYTNRMRIKKIKFFYFVERNEKEMNMPSVDVCGLITLSKNSSKFTTLHKAMGLNRLLFCVFHWIFLLLLFFLFWFFCAFLLILGSLLMCCCCDKKKLE